MCGGRILSDGVHKELLGVPMEQRRQIYIERRHEVSQLIDTIVKQDRSLDNFLAINSAKIMKHTGVDSHDCIGELVVSRLVVNPVSVVSSCHTK